MIIMPALALSLACAPAEPPAPEEPAADRITVVHSSRVDGDLDPCG